VRAKYGTAVGPLLVPFDVDASHVNWSVKLKTQSRRSMRYGISALLGCLMWRVSSGERLYVVACSTMRVKLNTEVNLKEPNCVVMALICRRRAKRGVREGRHAGVIW
jgi:hypothetical protein